MYESRCGTCEDRAGGEAKRKRMKISEDKIKGNNIYVGETSRSLYERCKEHIRDGQQKKEDSHIAKHWDDCHAGEEMPRFRFRIVKSFSDCLSRQVAESVRIDLREGVLNSKSVYSRNRLPRLELEKTEWEKEDEERKKRYQRWQEDKRKQEARKESQEAKTQELEEQEIEEENAMTEEWKRISNQREETFMSKEEKENEEPLKKRRKKRGEWRKYITHNWGLEPVSEEHNGIVRWLYEEDNSKKRQPDEGSKDKRTQPRIEPWSWLRLESWNLVIELARKIEEDHVKMDSKIEKESIEEITTKTKTKTKESETNVEAEDGKMKMKSKNQTDIRVFMWKAEEKILARKKEEIRLEIDKTNMIETERRKKVELLAKYHQMDWQEVENTESGLGEEMECERIQWNLVRGNGEGYRKRTRLKKLRWTEEARRLASLKGIVRRRNWKKAGRRL